MTREESESLAKAFGYIPDEPREKWCVYQDHSLIVIDPERPPRVYKRGAGGIPYEIVPCFP